MRIVDILEVGFAAWNSFVENHPLGNVFQTAEIYEVYRQTLNNEPIAVAVEENGLLKGVLLANIITNGGKLMRPFTARSIIIGGPLVLNNDDAYLGSLIDAYKNRLPGYVVYSELRPIYDLSSLESGLKVAGFERKGHYNLVLDVRTEIPDLWQQLHKERRRNINHAEKKGLEFREVVSDDEVLKITKLIELTYKRKRVPMSYSDMFVRLKQIMGKEVHFFAAYYNNDMIAGQIRLCYRDMVYAWFAGSDDAYFKLRPNDFLMWKVICWSHDQGYACFDFGGGGEPGVPYGVRDYKLKYGCDLNEYGRFSLIHKRANYEFGRLCVKLLGLKKS